MVKKFQHILGLCSSSQQRKLENRYPASNLCIKLEFFIGQKYTLLFKLLVITLTYHNLIYSLYFSDILYAIDVLCSTRSDIDIL